MLMLFVQASYLRVVSFGLVVRDDGNETYRGGAKYWFSYVVFHLLYHVAPSIF